MLPASGAGGSLFILCVFVYAMWSCHPINPINHARCCCCVPRCDLDILSPCCVLIGTWANFMVLRAASHTRLRARDRYISSTLIGGKGGAGPSSLHTTLEGPMEYVNARWM